ncbi:MAG: O-antigen ligase family protein [Flavobacteriaceae bacterium]|nr:O-antigen ligase family protein [Flavobacteriaceae bacterium]
MKVKSEIRYLQLIAFHILVGLTIYVAGFTSKLYLLGVVGFFLIRIFYTNNKNEQALIAAGYITGFEVFSRMTGGALTYEFAKYAVIMFLLIGMFYRGLNRKSWPYAIYILFLIPGILFSAINLNYGSNIANAIGFNLSGPVALGMAALYCYNRKISMQQLQQILLAVLLPIISMTVYLYLYTPSIRDVVTGTQSNFAASGGFGPNQVSTILGLGTLILFSRLLLIRGKFINLIDLSLLAFIFYRAVVTFSRGGVITAGVCAALFLLVYFIKAPPIRKATLIPKVSVIGGVAIIVWIFTSLSTSGLIDKRYANQDAAGREKADLTTGRAELLNEELEAFYENPLTGIGIGKAKEYRLEKTGRRSASHNELSRILSEHGVFGLFALGILMFTPLIFRLTNKSNLYLFTFVTFWFLTINHSSMRIAAPAFIYGLALISIVREAKKKQPALHRKSIK